MFDTSTTKLGFLLDAESVSHNLIPHILCLIEKNVKCGESGRNCWFYPQTDRHLEQIYIHDYDQTKQQQNSSTNGGKLLYLRLHIS